MTLKHACLLLTALILPACGDPAADIPSDGTPTNTPLSASDYTFCDVQSRLYDASCLSCHNTTGALSPPILAAGVSHGNTVDAAVATISTERYIVPGDPDSSYLVAKLENTHLDFDGGNGSQMPLGGQIDADIIAGVRAWIQNGASESCEGQGPTPTPTAAPTPTATPTPTEAPTPTAVPTPTDTPDPYATPTPTPWATPTPTETATPEPLVYTLTEVQAIFKRPINQSGCAGCHTGGGGQGGLKLDDAYTATVNVNSGDAGNMDYVEPGDPERSYLLLKLKGTHTAAGGSGSKMPQGGALSEDDIEGIEGWILDGAPDN